jgi:hypothetical protein
MITEPPSCPWCDRPFRPRRTGGRTQRFCRPLCRQAFHAAVRAWGLKAIATGAITLADLREGAAATCVLLPEAILATTVSDALGQNSHGSGAAGRDNALSGLLGAILDALSPEELGRLPAPIWALLDFVAGTDNIEAGFNGAEVNLNAPPSRIIPGYLPSSW